MKHYDGRIQVDRQAVARDSGGNGPSPAASEGRIEPKELLAYLDRRGEGYEGPLALWLTDLARDGRWLEKEGS